MTKSELVQRLRANNPHLYERDVETIVNIIFGQITAALARDDRVELRGRFLLDPGIARLASAAIHAPATRSR